MKNHGWLELLAGILGWTMLIAIGLIWAASDSHQIIELDARIWECQALDSDDGQCATYVKIKDHANVSNTRTR